MKADEFGQVCEEYFNMRMKFHKYTILKDKIKWWWFDKNLKKLKFFIGIF